MKYTGITIGADIEVFLRDIKTGEIVSAEGFIKGSKEHPFVFDPSNQYFATSLDNVLAEFCIPPATTEEEWVKNLNKSLNYINSDMEKYGLCTAILPSTNLHERWLATPHSQLFGCEPDIDAYSEELNDTPGSNDFTLRSAGGHVHIGFANATVIEEKSTNRETIENYVQNMDRQRVNLIKALDIFVGLPLVLEEPDNKRKELYGRAGAFRPKSYGVEYRTPSNYYLSTPETQRVMYQRIRQAISHMNATDGAIDEEFSWRTQMAINQNDKQAAKHLIEQINDKELCNI
jgi:hypothetical protein